MGIRVHSNSAVVLDLDDTLYKEIDFLKSAFREISVLLKQEVGQDIFHEMMRLFTSGKEVFGNIIVKYQIRSQNKRDLLRLYRNHKPNIKLDKHVAEKLEELKNVGVTLGLLTDGRSVTQRNKIKSLGIHDFFEEILISEEFGTEKPDERNFKYMQQNIDAEKYIYVGDNIRKDFIAPNNLGWQTICLLDDGSNIRPQHYSAIKDRLQRPQFFIDDFRELKVIL